jgi:hypothetical protein
MAHGAGQGDWDFTKYVPEGFLSHDVNDFIRKVKLESAKRCTRPSPYTGAAICPGFSKQNSNIFSRRL